MKSVFLSPSHNISTSLSLILINHLSKLVKLNNMLPFQYAYAYNNILPL